MTESVIRKRQPLYSLLPIAGVAIALGGCGHWPLFDDGPADEPAEEEPVAAVEKAGADTETEPESESETEIQPQARTGPGIATGSRAGDELYASLKAGKHALAPADTGYFIDVHEARLRQVLAETPIRMQRVEGRILLTIPGNLSFETNSAKIVAAVKPVLGDIATVLAEFDKTLVSVFGHTDDRGDAAYNQALSERRAVAVALFLAEKGVAKERLVGIGYGEERPVIEGETEAARTANRRVEILIKPVVYQRSLPQRSGWAQYWALSQSGVSL